MSNVSSKYNFYRRLILWFPIFSVLITLLISIGITYFTFQNYYKKEKEILKEEFFYNLKQITKQRVDTALKVLEYNYQSNLAEEKEKLEYILNLAVDNSFPIKMKHIQIKISNKPLKIDLNKYIYVFKKINGKFYYIMENKIYIKNKIKKSLSILFEAFRWGKKGYLFIFNTKGLCYYHINKSFIGENRWNIKRDGIFIVQKLIKAALLHPNGTYVKYLAYNPFGKPAEKISFVVYNKNLNLILGSGVYLNKLKKQLNILKNKKEILLKALIKKLLISFLILYIFISILSYFISEKILQRFKKYEESLNILEKEKLQKECIDPLSGFLNRNCLRKEFSKYQNQNIAVIDIDINDFKNINEIYGNKIGNELIKVISQKLKNQVKQTDMIGKGKIDEFIVLIKYKNKIDIDILLKRIYNILSRNIKIDSKEIYPSVRIGIAFNKIDGDDFDDLLNKASMSAYKVKNREVKIAFYNKSVDEKLKKYLETKTELLKIVRNNDFSEFEVYYQPQIDKNENLAGMEALIRWNHPQKGLISPGVFLPIAINEGMIKKIDLWTIETVIKQINQWLDKGFNPGVISCNVTMQQLESRDFITKLKSIIKKHHFDTRYFGIEVTEESIMQNLTNVNKTLNDIKEMGITISLDDFGTGYSNFMKLKTLPIDKLKIDKSFVDGIPKDKNDMSLIEVVIQTGKIFNMKLIAEGVETKEQKDFIFQNNVDYIQGYFYSKPLPSEKIEENYFKNK